MGKMKKLSLLAQELKQCSEMLDAISDELLSLISTDNETKTVEIKYEFVRAVLAEKSRLGFTKNIKEILSSFNAGKLSEVKSEDYEKLLEKVKELGSDKK